MYQVIMKTGDIVYHLVLECLRSSNSPSLLSSADAARAQPRFTPLPHALSVAIRKMLNSVCAGTSLERQKL
jgi:hypothetical protein